MSSCTSQSNRLVSFIPVLQSFGNMTLGSDNSWRNPNLLDEDEDEETDDDPRVNEEFKSNLASIIEHSHSRDADTNPFRRTSSLEEPSPFVSADKPLRNKSIDTTGRSHRGSLESSSPSNIGLRGADQRSGNGTPVHSQQQRPRRIPSNMTGLGGSPRVVIAVDYGTTYTGLAVAQTQSGHANIDEIEVVQDWGVNGDNQSKVRTMISYVKSSAGKTQWGSAVTDHAMVNTKLELEPQASRYDELELTWYLLKGTGNLAFEHLKKIGPEPAYTSAPPRQIVQDYLSHIRACACREGVLKKVDLSKLVETNTPVDIVVTVPAVSGHFLVIRLLC